MKNNSTPTGYVPVTLHLPENLAEKLTSPNFNWEPLAELLGNSTTPEELAEHIRIIYFEYSRLLIQHQSDYSSKTVDALFIMQLLHEALFKMCYANSRQDGADANHPE